MGLSLIVGSAYHKNTDSDAEPVVERANGVIGYTLLAYANGGKDDWDLQLPLADSEFAINSAASTLATWCLPSSTAARIHGSRSHRRSALDKDVTPESPGQYARRMRQIEATLRELQAAAHAARKATLGAGRVDTVFKVGDRALLRTKELLDAADIGGARGGTDPSR